MQKQHSKLQQQKSSINFVTHNLVIEVIFPKGCAIVHFIWKKNCSEIVASWHFFQWPYVRIGLYTVYALLLWSSPLHMIWQLCRLSTSIGDRMSV